MKNQLSLFEEDFTYTMKQTTYKEVIPKPPILPGNKSTKKTIHVHTPQLSNYKKKFDKVYREMKPAAKNAFEINDSIIVFIVIIALIGIFISVLQ